MPQYEFRCDTCKTTFELVQSITKKLPSKCMNCGERSESQFYQVYGNIGMFIKGSPTTFGQQSELNEKRVGKARLDEMAEKQIAERRGFTGKLPVGASVVTQPKAELPWFRSGDTPGLPKMDKVLDVSTIKDKKKYIETGDKT